MFFNNNYYILFYVNFFKGIDMKKNYTDYEIEEIWNNFINNVNHVKEVLKDSNDIEKKHYILYVMAYLKYHDNSTYKHMLSAINSIYKTIKNGDLYEIDDNNNDINIDDDI